MDRASPTAYNNRLPRRAAADRGPPGPAVHLAVTGFTHLQAGLACDAVPLADIAAAAGTPVYVYSADVIRERYRALTHAFASVPHAVHYALKANSNFAVVRLLRALGAGVDANSVGEIEVALRAGFSPGEVVFTGVGKGPAELERAVALGLKTINAESPGELDRIEAIASRLGTAARIAVRVNPDIDAQSHPHISTGLKRNKFGVPYEQALELCRGMRARPALALVGVHVHIGSQITALEPLRRAAQAGAAFAAELARDGIALEHLDVGGGLGISYDGGPVPDADAYAAAILEPVGDTGLTLLLEPGRWLVAPAGALVASVVDVKTHPDGRRFVVLDAGMTELLRPALYGAFHRIVPVRPGGRPEAVCDVVGPVCESSDAFGVDRRLPDPRVGDLVALLDAGAYGAVMGSNYNRRPMPPEILVDGGEWRVVRRRQTVDDLLACEE